jgi:excinuclease ABC subunit C
MFHVEHSIMSDTSFKPDIQEIVRKLPGKPGVYQFLNRTGDLIYIGKAKNLKKRVASYFTRSEQHSYKHDALVRQIHDIHYILVEDESDALLLENNLIKENQPKYNIMLKDDKTYPWIVIPNEGFPRVMLTRNYISDGSLYFGPYTSVVMVRSMLDLIRQLFKVRTCKLSLTKENIDKGKFRHCLEFDLGNCLAPCEGLQSAEDYASAIKEIKEILKGNFQDVILHLKESMQGFAKSYHFEMADLVRLKIETLEKYKARSTIVNPKISNVDVFSVVDEEHYAYVNFMKIAHGAIVQSHNVEVVKRITEVPKEILSYVIFDLRARFGSDAREIILPVTPDICPAGVIVTVPKQGDKRKLLELSGRNAMSYKKDREMAREAMNRSDSITGVLEELKKDLRLKVLPKRMECFDNSNIQGTNPVASCVVFENGKPKKSAYRHYNIKTVSGPNDFASMEEIIYRRYSRLIEEGTGLPDLIIVDGGKGQLSAAVNSMDKLKIRQKIAIVGIAKRLEEIYVPGDSIPLYLDKNSQSLRLIQQMRNEAHRFGITFHRQKRNQSLFESEMDRIPGIGTSTKEKIQLKVKDFQLLRSMSLEEIGAITGKRAARILQDYFRQKGTSQVSDEP